jgi:hypothetical protein
MEAVMSRHRKEQRYLVELVGANFRIHDRRTGKYRTYYAAEFVYGCMDYDPDVGRYPNYVHGEVWRLHNSL